MRTGELKELVCSGNDSIKCISELKPVRRLNDLVRIGGHGSHNNSTGKRVLNILEAS